MEVEERFAGQRGPCAVCAKTISIPLTDGTPAAEPTAITTASKKYDIAGGSRRISVGSILLVLSLCFGGVVMLAICGGGIFNFGIPAIRQATVTAKNQNSLDHLQRISDALDTYHIEHGTYPPPYFTDKNGKPTHSWRVMILPQLGYSDIYGLYNFEEAWDSPSNLNVLHQMPYEYQSFNERNPFQGQTRFVVITSKDSMFPPGESVSDDDVSDDEQTVLLVVELNGATIEWTNPNKEIRKSVNPLIIQNDPDNTAGLTGTISGNVVMVNGDTHTLPDDTGTQLMKDMSNRDGGEDIGEDLDLLINF